MEVNYALKSQISVETNGGKLPFDGFHNVESESYYSPYKFQNDLTGDTGGLHESFSSNFSFHEHSPLSFSPRVTQDDPYQLMDCSQDITNDRNLRDVTNSGSEADLYGLVSTILDDADPLDSDLCQEISTGPKTMWSPNSVSKNSLHYLNSEVQMRSIRNPQLFQSERDQQQIQDNYHELNGFETWPLSACNIEPDVYRPTFSDLPRPPPGLDISPATSSYFLKSRPVRSDQALAGNENSNDSYFSSYQDVSVLSRPELEMYKPFLLQDSNRLSNNIQALLLREQQNVYSKAAVKNNAVLLKHDSVCDLTSNPYQRKSVLADHIPNVQRGVAASLRQQTAEDLENKINPLQHNSKTYETSGFEVHSTDSYVQPPKSFISTFNFSSPYQNSVHQHHHGQTNFFQNQTKLPTKSSVHINSQMRSIPMSQSVAEVLSTSSSPQPHRSLPRILPDFQHGDGVNLPGRINKTGLGLDSLRNVAEDDADFDVQLEMDALHTASAPGFIPDTLSPQWYGTKPKRQTGFLRERDKKQGLLQSPFQILGNMYAGQSRPRRACSSPPKPVPVQMFPCLFQMTGSGKNPCHLFSSRSSFPYNGSMPVLDTSETLPDVDLKAMKPHLQDVMGSSTGEGDGLFLGFLSSLRSAKVSRNRGAPACQLHHYLEECYEQWRMLEKERKKTDAILMKSYPGKHLPITTSNVLPKMPPNPSRVDRLIVDQLREQAKVVSLLGKMERLRSFPLHANIGSMLDRHMEAICVTQARRKDEFLNGNRQRLSPAYPREDRDVLLLASALKDLSSSTRKSRTVLWCALQMALPKTNPSAEKDVEQEACLALGTQSPDLVVPEGVESALKMLEALG